MKLDAGRAMQWIHALRGFWLTEERLRAINMPMLIIGSGLDAGHFGPTAAMSKALHAQSESVQPFFIGMATSIPARATVGK